ncbi:NAD-dependent epimerase/dehydratase family protein [Chitinilyticum piscinae]|uniref:NAD-dependent epimerase/dehydratase family protein n=1 Tax=Chitinilyticum piscinae TaxID=2866724 RepID=A0A8J7KFL0_9NEIS|nr:NAD-dependent epimerase/dehydratase family protein [Chitinilyticum piscinae]MBE9610074.1 NAD-dependent epimerase/dehydratase family protein [Chitinilyticum piscinae]
MRKKRLLIIGCGDVVRRALPWLSQRFQLFALVRSIEQPALRAAGVHLLHGDLDDRTSLKRLAGLADYVLHSAPPSAEHPEDLRTVRLCQALGRPRRKGMVSHPPRHAVYISTSGIYGDCQGARIDETHPAEPESARAKRRVSAERTLRRWAQRQSIQLAILRAPGIYAEDRLPLERLLRGTPVLHQAEDSFSNHIHADDLAKICCLALFRGRPLRSYNASDDCPVKMGDWFDALANTYQLPLPQRICRQEAPALVGTSLWSFMRESRQLDNQRMKTELRVRLKHPCALDFVKNEGV